MQTFKLYENNPNTRILSEIADAIRKGAIVIYPTDSVYAIGCDVAESSLAGRGGDKLHVLQVQSCHFPCRKKTILVEGVKLTVT